MPSRNDDAVYGENRLGNTPSSLLSSVVGPNYTGGGTQRQSRRHVVRWSRDGLRHCSVCCREELLMPSVAPGKRRRHRGLSLPRSPSHVCIPARATWPDAKRGPGSTWPSDHRHDDVIRPPRPGGAVDQGGQSRHPLDSALLSSVSGERGAPAARRHRLQSRQSLAPAGFAPSPSRASP